MESICNRSEATAKSSPSVAVSLVAVGSIGQTLGQADAASEGAAVRYLSACHSDKRQVLLP